METLHPSEIDLGLSRIRQVAQRLGISKTRAKVITVAGTNGKGSCIATLEKILTDNHNRVGSYTSPHITRYNERIRLDRCEIDDQTLCDTFTLIDQARAEISLTYFEFGTLAALYIFAHNELDYWLLEIGLGGRLDAVNIIDPDVAVITSIDLDHEAWLGDTREKIAVEKLGILRSHVACVCAEPKPTENMEAIFTSMEVKPANINHAFSAMDENNGQDVRFTFTNSMHKVQSICVQRPSLPVNSVAAALQVLCLLNVLPDEEGLTQSLSQLSLFGRFETITFKSCQLVMDVAHNPAAARLLVDNLTRVNQRPSIAVVGMMADKNIAQTLSPLCPMIDNWITCEFKDMPRSAKSNMLADTLIALGIDNKNVVQCSDVDDAMIHALQKTQTGDQKPLIVVFGSFITVSLAHDFLENSKIE